MCDVAARCYCDRPIEPSMTARIMTADLFGVLTRVYRCPCGSFTRLADLGSEHPDV